MKRTDDEQSSSSSNERKEEEQSIKKIEPICLFWKDARKFALKHLVMWKEIEIENVYDFRNKCNVEECWYKRHLDRLSGLELYEFNEHIICNVCWENNLASEILPFDKEKKDIYELEIDVEMLEQNLRQQIEKLEVRDNCEKCGEFFYLMDKFHEYFEACSTCLYKLHSEYGEIDKRHKKCNSFSIFLCDNCIFHEGEVAYSQGHHGGQSDEVEDDEDEDKEEDHDNESLSDCNDDDDDDDSDEK